MDHTNLFYVSPKIAIRNALGDSGYGGVEYQTLLPDLIRWTAEAQDLIIKNKKSLPITTEEIVIYNSQIRNRRDFQKLECVSIEGHPIILNQRSHSSPLVTTGSPTRFCGGNPWGISYEIDQYNMTFSPAIEDGKVAEVQFLCKPCDEEGYPMIIEICSRAIGLYVAMKLYKRLRDNRYEDTKQDWLFACRQARAECNSLTQEQLESIGAAWINMNRRNGYQYYW